MPRVTRVTFGAQTYGGKETRLETAAEIKQRYDRVSGLADE